MWGLPQKQNARRAYKIRLCGHLRRYKKIVKKTYIIYKNSLIFHLRGGIDYSKLNFKHKTMMKMLYHSLKNKPVESLTQEDKALIETYNTKVDFVDYDSLKQIVEVIQ